LRVQYHQSTAHGCIAAQCELSMHPATPGAGGVASVMFCAEA
jgi:hypothetical protein